MNSMDRIIDGMECYYCYQQWERKIVQNDVFNEFHETHHVSEGTKKWAALGGSVLLGTAKLALTPVLSTVGMVVLPILGAIRKDKTLLIAGCFAFVDTLLKGGFICLCIFVFTPKTAIILSVFIGAGAILSKYSEIRKGPHTYGDARPLGLSMLRAQKDWRDNVSSDGLSGVKGILADIRQMLTNPEPLDRKEIFYSGY